MVVSKFQVFKLKFKEHKLRISKWYKAKLHKIHMNTNQMYVLKIASVPS